MWGDISMMMMIAFRYDLFKRYVRMIALSHEKLNNEAVIVIFTIYFIMTLYFKIKFKKQKSIKAAVIFK